MYSDLFDYVSRVPAVHHREYSEFSNLQNGVNCQASSHSSEDLICRSNNNEKIYLLATLPLRLTLPEEGWFGQPKYSTPAKNHPTLCRYLLLYILHLYVKPIRSLLIQRIPAGSPFRLRVTMIKFSISIFKNFRTQ